MKLLLLSLQAAAGLPLNLTLSVQPNGAFSIAANGHQWLAGAECIINGLSASAGSLTLVGPPTSTTGRDALGAFDARTFKWASAEEPAKVLAHTSFRVYPQDPSTIVFEQFFPQELRLRGRPFVHTLDGLFASTIFPGFARNSGPADLLPCFAFHAVFPKMESCTFSSYDASHQGGTPLVVYNRSHERLPMLVFSQLNQPKAAHLASSDAFIGAGIKATATSIPKDWRQLFILTGAEGINDGMMHWGDRMLAFSGKKRPSLYRDVTHSSIGFWTDNGGYYHYDTGVDPSKTYEQVLPEVKAYHDSLGVPFRHWQFDSWFYPKDGGVEPGGGGGAVTNWTAMPSVFPRGMAHIHSLLGVPMVMHNRQWSSKSDYIDLFEWHTSKCCAVPKDPGSFFLWFFKQQAGWGLTMYEQDWMCTEYDGVSALQTALPLADDWLAGMAEGAAASGRTVQYCMPYGHDILSGRRLEFAHTPLQREQSTRAQAPGRSDSRQGRADAHGLPSGIGVGSAHSAVTNARATGDYLHAKDQWAIGATALLYWALGILPFKDGFYSSTHRQIGGQSVGPETAPDREILMATLSGAMVGAMDGIHLLNATRVLASCRADGYILKPDRPLATVEGCFKRAKPEACYTYGTYTDLSGLGRVHYVFMNTPEPLPRATLQIPKTGAYAVYNWYTGGLSSLEDVEATPVAPGYEGHSYAIVTPIRSGWIMLGEVEKYVPTSALRVSNVKAMGQKLTLDVTGVANEAIRICAANVANWMVVCVPHQFSAHPTVHRMTFFVNVAALA